MGNPVQSKTRGIHELYSEDPVAADENPVNIALQLDGGNGGRIGGVGYRNYLQALVV